MAFCKEVNSSGIDVEIPDWVSTYLLIYTNNTCGDKIFLLKVCTRACIYICTYFLINSLIIVLICCFFLYQMAKGRVVCLYRGEDINWIQKFTTTAKAVAEAVGINLELVYVGKNKDGQYYLEDQMKWLGPINKVCCKNLV